MPRSGSGVYSRPAGSAAVTGTVINSSDYNATIDDLVADANAARPVVAGGTGGTTAAAARANLSAQVASAVLDGFVAAGLSSGELPIKRTGNSFEGAEITSLGESVISAATASALRQLIGAPPSGHIIWMATDSAPSGYLKADGSAVSRSTYADLYAAIGTTFGEGNGTSTFNLPDLRGEFIRGWDDGRGVDSGRAFGSDQGDALEEHSHDIRYARRINTDTAGLDDADSLSIGADFNDRDLIGDVRDGTAASETRPRNVALLACIKT